MTPELKDQADLEPAATLLEFNEHPRTWKRQIRGIFSDILKIGGAGQLRLPLYQGTSASKLVDKERVRDIVRACKSVKESNSGLSFWIRISETVEPSESRIVHRAWFFVHFRCLIVYHCLPW